MLLSYSCRNPQSVVDGERKGVVRSSVALVGKLGPRAFDAYLLFCSCNFSCEILVAQALTVHASYHRDHLALTAIQSVFQFL